MEKVKKQITVNVLLVVISLLVIFISQSIANQKILPWQEYLGSDFLLVLITSLGTLLGWRFSESICYKWIYNLVIGCVMFFLILFYGISMAMEMNNLLLLFLQILSVVFVIFYVWENIIIAKEQKRRIANIQNSVGY